MGGFDHFASPASSKPLPKQEKPNRLLGIPARSLLQKRGFLFPPFESLISFVLVF